MFLTSRTLGVALATLLIPAAVSSLSARITLEKRGTYETGIFDESAAEIVDHDWKTQRLFVVNADTDSIDVLDVSDVDNPSLAFSIDVSPWGSPNSVAVDPRNRIDEIAVAVEAPVVTDPGFVLFFDTDGNFIKSLQVGALPDMVAYGQKGKKLAVANEGEPDGGIDPEGSVSLISVPRGGALATQDDVVTIGFGSLDIDGAPDGLRLFPGVESIAQDLEPEYIAFSPYGVRLWVTLQEANAVAVINTYSEKLEKVIPLGTIDHDKWGFGIDASDKDDIVNIMNWPVHGMFMPDSIASYSYQGNVYYITANEGDDRGEDERIEDLDLDPIAFPNAAILQDEEMLGRLGVSSIDGDTDGDGDYDELYSYGTRSFTIWDANGRVIFDSGDDFETITSMMFPDDFNSSNDDNDDFDSRSDAKGPEPEAVTVANFWGRTYAFIGLERIGGIMVYDVTNPKRVKFVEYVNNRDFSADAETSEAGDLGPEGLKFISAHRSPTKTPLLVVANEVSGTTTIYEIKSLYEIKKGQ